ncbi:HRAD1 [Lepeophtheirus salmonis]|uniref:HRAD1 n=1 Tax=Lepeophtheirus salmonis TaxID=72036 RepID=A0A7R8H1E8_LEPSM|nr:HRAD1 [Lepeophtheirus salmonis]CAF2805987.1 HRAD1 [Lepeophtheirus salmonis]
MSFSQLDLTNADDGTCGEFRAKLFRAKTLFTFIKAVHFRDDGNVFISPNGIKVTVEDSKCFQGNAFVQRNLFNTGQLQLHYSTRSNELCLHIEDQGTVSEAVIRTQDSEETLDFSFGRDEVIFKTSPFYKFEQRALVGK